MAKILLIKDNARIDVMTSIPLYFPLKNGIKKHEIRTIAKNRKM